MKRIVPVLLSHLLLVGSLLIPGPGPMAENAGPTPAPMDGPQVVGPFLRYRFFEQDGWENRTSGVMFEADLDQDGVAEPVSFALRTDDWATAITWGKSTVVLESDEFVEAAVLDLDPASPFYNLLVVVDYGSDSYVTVELHPENGKLVQGTIIGGSWTWEDDQLWFFQRTDLLGTASGKRTYRGDDLHPDSEWLTMAYIPTAEELAGEREDLIEFGTLLHTIQPVPCTIDGQPGFIPADTCLYRLRFREDDALMEVALLDGTVAQIASSLSEDDWYLIDGRDMTEYFDNLFFAD